MEESFEWINSLGGPLILIPHEELVTWQGIDGSSESGKSSDYERAGEVEDELGIIKCGSQQAFVLGDEPHSTAWVAQNDGGILVRWVYGETHAAVIAAVNTPSLIDTLGDTDLELDATECRRWHLFDSGAPSYDLRGERSILDFEAGRYQIKSGYIDDGPEVRLLLHRLLKK